MQKRKSENKTEDDTTPVFNYAATVEGPLFDRLPLSSETLEQSKSKADDITGEAICDAAESVLDMANQLGFTVCDVRTEIQALGVLYKYINQLENGGFSQWVYNTCPLKDTEMIKAIEVGLASVKAPKNLKVFKEAIKVVKGLPEADMTMFEDSEYFADGPHTAIRDKLDKFNERMWELAVAPDDGKSKEECLRIILNNYANKLAKQDNVVTEVTDEAIISTDPFVFLTPSWWPAKIPEADITKLEDSQTLLCGLRRAAATQGFGFVRFGYAPENVPAKQTKKSKKSGKTPSLPKVPEAKEIFQTDGPDDDEPPTPTPSTSPFWIVTTAGPLVCQIFDTPSGEEEEKGKEEEEEEDAIPKTAGTEEEKEEDTIPKMAVFFNPDGTPCGIGPLDEILDDDEEGEEGEGLFDIQEGEEGEEGEGDDEAPDLVPV